MVLGLAVALFLLNAAQFCLHSTWAFSMQNRFNWTPKEVGFSLLAVGVMSMIVQGGVVRKLVPAIGEEAGDGAGGDGDDAGVPGIWAGDAAGG